MCLIPGNRSWKTITGSKDDQFVPEKVEDGSRLESGVKYRLTTDNKYLLYPTMTAVVTIRMIQFSEAGKQMKACMTVHPTIGNTKFTDRKVTSFNHIHRNVQLSKSIILIVC